jgi:hypothetical protein
MAFLVAAPIATAKRFKPICYPIAGAPVKGEIKSGKSKATFLIPLAE